MAQTTRKIAEKDRELAVKAHELEKALRNLSDTEDSKRRTEEEVGVARQRLAEMEGALSSTSSELGAMKQVSICMRAHTHIYIYIQRRM